MAMLKTELVRRINDMISLEDSFIEEIAAMDLTTIKHSKFRVTSYLGLKSGLTKLLDDSRRHREILTELVKIVSGDDRNEY
jgi:hypothetical protein